MSASFCWQCGKQLVRLRTGELSFRDVTPHGHDGSVRVHVECAKNLKATPPDHAQSVVKRDVRRYLETNA